jgi:hypothetical protein
MDRPCFVYLVPASILTVSLAEAASFSPGKLLKTRAQWLSAAKQSLARNSPQLQILISQISPISFAACSSRQPGAKTVPEINISLASFVGVVCFQEVTIDSFSHMPACSEYPAHDYYWPRSPEEKR